MPLNPDNVFDFDPNDVPSLEDILRDMETNVALNKDKDPSKKRPHSSPKLDRYVGTFKKSFLNPLLKDYARSQRTEVAAF